MTNFNGPEFYEGDVALFRDHVARPYLEQREAAQAYRARMGELMELDRLPKQPDPATRCRVLTANFRHRERGGETYVPKVGDTITMPRTEALDAAALGRVQILKSNGAN
jgi:hypothetical protein